MAYYTIYTFYEGEFKSKFHGDIEYVKGIFDNMVFSEEFENGVHALAIKTYAGETTLMSPKFMCVPLGSWIDFNMNEKYYLYTSQLSLLSAIKNPRFTPELNGKLDSSEPPSLGPSINTNDIRGNYKLIFSSRHSNSTIIGAKSYINGIVDYLNASDVNERDLYLMATSDHDGIMLEMPECVVSNNNLSWFLDNNAVVLDDMCIQVGYNINDTIFDYILALCRYLIDEPRVLKDDFITVNFITIILGL